MNDLAKLFKEENNGIVISAVSFVSIVTIGVSLMIMENKDVLDYYIPVTTVLMVIIAVYLASVMCKIEKSNESAFHEATNGFEEKKK